MKLSFLKKHAYCVIACKYIQISLISCVRQQNISSINQCCFSKNFSTNMKENHIVSDLHREWVSKFESNNVPEPEASIKYIIEHVLGMKKAYQYELAQNNKVTEDQVKKISDLCECRLARMPVQYIIKEWDFRDLRLNMCPPVFIPRPETEQLVDLVVEAAPNNATILEVGCGTGAISLSLVKALPDSKVVAIDQSKMAYELTLKNAHLNDITKNLQVVHSKLNEDGTLSQPLPKGLSKVDVIVSNPPYIPYAQMMDLEPEIKLYEDLRALEAGRDGLRVIKSILLLGKTLLRPGGPIFLEVDTTHPKLIKKWLSDHPELNISFVKSTKDYCDRDRFVELQKLC